MMELLHEKLETYAKGKVYPFHMPGHKRKEIVKGLPYELDITEIDGFDNLHQATEILYEAQKKAAKLYGALESFYLINGSTCGLLAAICATNAPNTRILVARNCHKAVYHAIELFGLSADYLYPTNGFQGICGQITKEEIRKKLEEETQRKGTCPYRTLVITSPTYDGVVSDIEGIAQIVHEYGMLLIVDEAHGAHFGLSPLVPKSAISKGADLVIQSLHKTLPSFTQTALLHICSDRVKAKQIKRQLDIFETSSPSYVLMAGMDACISFLEKEKDELFESYYKRMELFYERTKSLKYLHVMTKQDIAQECYDFDWSKILIFTTGAAINGKELYDILLNEYDLQMEMVSKDYVLGMTSIMDTDEGLNRLCQALEQIDQRKELAKSSQTKEFAVMYERAQPVCTIAQARQYECTWIDAKLAEDCVSGEYVYLYPPGIPLLTPGEKVTKEILLDVQEYERSGLSVTGLCDGKMCTLVI